MSKKQIKKIIFMGVGCALLLIVGTIYSLLYNDGRWVKNMDMSEYRFSLLFFEKTFLKQIITI